MKQTDEFIHCLCFFPFFSSVTQSLITPPRGIKELSGFCSGPAILLNLPLTGKSQPEASRLPWGQEACLPEGRWDSTCKHHEDSYSSIHLEPVGPRAAVTHSGAQKDGACQHQEGIQDLGPDGQPEHTCKM